MAAPSSRSDLSQIDPSGTRVASLSVCPALGSASRISRARARAGLFQRGEEKIVDAIEESSGPVLGDAVGEAQVGRRVEVDRQGLPQQRLELVPILGGDGD